MKNKRKFSKSLIFIIMVFIFSLSLFTTESFAASYSSDYRYWNQLDSDYDWIKNYGCLVVAEAKLLYASGVDRSQWLNPDTYYDWKNATGFGNGNWNSLETYASQKGKTLVYMGECSSDDSQLWANINAGYYTILQLNNHWVLVDNDVSKANGAIYVDQSGSYYSNLPYGGNGPRLLSDLGYQRIKGYYFYSKPTIPTNVLNLGNNFYAYMIMSNHLELFNVDVNSSVVLQKGVYLDKKQIWNFTRQSDGSYVIKNVETGRYLDVLNSNDYDGGVIRTSSYNGSNSQKFFLYGTQDNCVIRPACSTIRTVSVDGGSNIAGKKLNMWEYWGVETQLFNIWKVNEAKASVLNYNVNGSKVTLNWTKGENADKYNIIIKSGTVGNLKEYKKIVDIAETSYSISLPAGYYEVTVEGWNYFSHDFSNVVKFTIANNTTNISKCNIGIEKSSYVYTGSNISPKITIKNGNTTLKNGTNYTVSYKNNKNVGTATVTITGKGNYTGTVTKTFKITPKAISKTTISGISNKTYTGKSLTQSIKVKDGNTTLKNGTNYTVSYKNNKNVGTATIVIKGKGNYTGTIKKTFYIKPKGTSLKNLTKGSKQFKATWGKNTTQTTGYEVQYSTTKNFNSGNKTVNIQKNKTTSTTVKKLKKNKKYYVRIRTYKTVNGKKYYSGWSKVLNFKTK